MAFYLEPLPPTPEHLGPTGRQFWAIATGLGWLSSADVPMLVLLAEQLDRRAELLEQVEREGHTLATPKGYVYLNPAVSALSTLETAIGRALVALGMSTADRLRLGFEVAVTESVVDQLRERRRRRLAGEPVEPLPELPPTTENPDD